MANGFRVNSKARTVKVYRLSMAENDYKIIDRYKSMGYDVEMLEKKEPQKKSSASKDDLLKYLDNGNIPTAIYNEMKERIQKKQNFLRVKSWLITELKDYAEENRKEYIPLNDIIQNAKEKENLINAQKEEINESKEDKSKIKVVENKTETNKK